MAKRTRQPDNTRPETGSVLLFAIFVIIMAMLASATAVSLSMAETGVVTARVAQLKLESICASGVGDAMANLENGGTGIVNANLDGGSYSSEVFQEDGFTVLLVQAQWSNQNLFRLVKLSSVHQVFGYTVYAGNSGGSGTYQLTFDDNDYVASGAVHANAAVVFQDSADAAAGVVVTSTVSVSGLPGAVVAAIASPDLQAMSYDVNHHVNVAEALNDEGIYTVYDRDGVNVLGLVTVGGDLGALVSGLGLFPDDVMIQVTVPATNPAHIFTRIIYPRDTLLDLSLDLNLALNLGLNLDDDEYTDYYTIEDPYEANPGEVSITANGNELIYYLDTDGLPLLVDSFDAESVAFLGADTRITIVVTGGDLAIADEFTGPSAGSVALLAVKDGGGQGGDLYVGVPGWGTLGTLENVILYAEDTLHILTHDEEQGSTTLTFSGAMGAGDRIGTYTFEDSSLGLIGFVIDLVNEVLGGGLGDIIGGLIGGLLGGGGSPDIVELEEITFSSAPQGLYPPGLPPGIIGEPQEYTLEYWTDFSFDPTTGSN